MRLGESSTHKAIKHISVPRQGSLSPEDLHLIRSCRESQISVASPCGTLPRGEQWPIRSARSVSLRLMIEYTASRVACKPIVAESAQNFHFTTTAKPRLGGENCVSGWSDNPNGGFNTESRMFLYDFENPGRILKHRAVQEKILDGIGRLRPGGSRA